MSKIDKPQILNIVETEAFNLSKITSLTKVLRHSLKSDYLKEKISEEEITDILEIIENISDQSFHKLFDLLEI